ncbi:MAG TPA: glycosyltransferase family 39 protein [Planctomycetota bacterium]|nr:glycosyltransferase family 39 protein [Planctomycetota bacterium]
MTGDAAQAGPPATAPGTDVARRRKAPVSPAALLVIGVLALVLRLGYVLSTDAVIEFPDEQQYLNMAQNFVAGNGLSISADPQGRAVQPMQTMQRPPVYPLMLAVILRLDLYLRTVRVVQAVLGALMCVMLYLLARELVAERAARIAGVIAAVYPFFIYFTGRILSETLFLLLFVTSWYFIVRMWKDLSARERVTEWLGWCLIGGFLSAGAVLTRSSVLAVYLAVPVVMVVMGPRRRAGLLVGLLMLVVLGAGLSAWAARNWKHVEAQRDEGAIVLTTCKVGESLYEAVGPRATGGPNKENTIWPEELDAMRQDEYGRNQHLLGRSLSYMRHNPKRPIRLAGKKFLRTWNVVPNYAGARSMLYVAVSLASYVPVLLTGLAGIFLCMRRPRSVVWLMLPIVVFTLLHVVFVGSVRYRLVMMPFLIVFSAVTVWRLFGGRFKPVAGTVEEE